MGTRISQLPAASSVSTADIIPVVQGGVTKRVSVAAMVGSAIAVGPAGPQGEQGDIGPVGPQGPAGSPGSGGGGTSALDRVIDTTTTSGTGSFALARNAPVGSLDFTDYGYALNEYAQYSVANDDETEWEIGVGRFNSVNLAMDANDFSDTTIWTRTGLNTVTADSVTAPDGTLTADAIKENGANSTHKIASFSAGDHGHLDQAITAGATHVLSFYVKPGTRTKFEFELFDMANSGNWLWAEFDTTAVSVTNSAFFGTATLTSCTITAAANGFYRIVAVFSMTTAVALDAQFFIRDSAGNYTFTGTNGNTSCSLWGWQIEQGSSVTDFTGVVNRLERVRVWYSSNDNALVSFSAGTKTVSQAVTGEQVNGLVNVKLFGAVGDGVTDDREAIQEAIYYAEENKHNGVYMPKGNYLISSRIELNPRGNDWDLSTGQDNDFSLCLVGENGAPNGNRHGTTILADFSNDVAIGVGPGQGMMVRNLNIVQVDDTSTYRTIRNGDSIGIGVAGESSGPSRTLIDNCWIENFYYGFATAANGDGTLGDANTIRRCHFEDNAISIGFLGTQNYVNRVDDCTANGYFKAIESIVGKPVVVTGGNFSTSSLSATFTIGSVSTLTDAGTGTNGLSHEYTFTAVVSSPTSNLDNNLFNVACVVTTGHGVIPLTIDSFDTGTDTITLRIGQDWVFYQFGGNTYDVIASSDVQAEIQAITTLYVAEMVTIFDKAQVALNGCHIENPSAVTRFYDGRAGTTVNHSSFKNITFNYGVALGALSTTSPLFLNQQVHSFLYLAGIESVTIENWHQVESQNDYLLVEWGAESSATRLYVRECNLRFNLRVNGVQANDSQGSYVEIGGGFWERSRQLPHPQGSTAATIYGSMADNGVVYQGNRPLGTLSIAPNTLRNNLSTIGAIGTYNPRYGEVGYVVNSTTVTEPAAIVRFHHNGWSYGQDITAAWGYKGQSNILYMTSAAQNFLFAGLVVNLTINTSAVQARVHGLYPRLGYIQARRMITGETAGAHLGGVANTTYSGATLGQDTFQVSMAAAPLTAMIGADYTLADSSAAQKAFNASTNGALVVVPGVYELRANYVITDTAAPTPHTYAVQFGGTSSVSAIAYTAQSHVGATTALTAVNQIHSSATAAKVVTAASSGNAFIGIALNGIVRVGTGGGTTGTFIPQVKLDTTAGAAPVMLANSYVRMTPLSYATTALFTGRWI